MANTESLFRSITNEVAIAASATSSPLINELDGEYFPFTYIQVRNKHSGNILIIYDGDLSRTDFLEPNDVLERRGELEYRQIQVQELSAVEIDIDDIRINIGNRPKPAPKEVVPLFDEDKETTLKPIFENDLSV